MGELVELEFTMNRAAAFGKGLEWFQADVKKVRGSDDAIALLCKDFLAKHKDYLIEIELLLPIVVMLHDHYSKNFVLNHLHLELENHHVKMILEWIRDREDQFGL